MPEARLIGLGVGTAGMFANTRYLRNNQIIPQELKAIAHFHWAGSSYLLMSAIIAPIAVNRLVGLATGAFLIRYAIFQGRRSPTSVETFHGHVSTEEIWVYLGL